MGVPRAARAGLRRTAARVHGSPALARLLPRPVEYRIGAAACGHPLPLQRRAVVRAVAARSRNTLPRRRSDAGVCLSPARPAGKLRGGAPDLRRGSASVTCRGPLWQSTCCRSRGGHRTPLRYDRLLVQRRVLPKAMVHALRRRLRPCRAADYVLPGRFYAWDRTLDRHASKLDSHRLAVDWARTRVPGGSAKIDRPGMRGRPVCPCRVDSRLADQPGQPRRPRV